MSACARRGATLRRRTLQPDPPAQDAPGASCGGKECGEAGTSETPLPNSAIALQQRKQIKILAIGASSTAVIGWRREGGPPLLEQILERTINGVDVEIINRGFSGELAEAAGKRIEIEVALNHPDIVLWQVGTNDAFAQVPVESFQLSVSNTVRWLKAHNVDVILVGLHYMKQLANNPHYQAIRDSLNASPPPRTCCASAATRRWRSCRARCARRPAGPAGIRPVGGRPTTAWPSTWRAPSPSASTPNPAPARAGHRPPTR